MKHARSQNNGSSANCSRRTFLLATGSAAVGALPLGCAAPGTSLWAGLDQASGSAGQARIAPAGPASKYVPSIQVAFVRRKGDYGMRWPGAIYDGQAALTNYRRQIEATAKELGLRIAIRPAPIHTPAEADQWLAQAEDGNPDGLLVVLLDRQEHSWPTAGKAIDSGVPTVVFAPIGAAFTTNTRRVAERDGAFICSTDDFSQVAWGMKMIKAGAKLREMRFIVLRGDQRRDTDIKHIGTKLRYVPARDFLDEYHRTPLTDEIKSIAAEYIRHATRTAGPTEQDVINGVKSYAVARTILEREEGDGITMDCLGALGPTRISLPCIAWSRMLDHGVPAACEADLEACVTHALVQYLFDRPGFQQDPVPETATGCLIGAHCTCPIRLNGFTEQPEPYYLSHHHGKRDAVPRTMWRIGQRVTVADVLLSRQDDERPKMIISAGRVVNNVAVPPSGGCVVSVALKLDGVTDLLAYPGFHQIFFYGDYQKELQGYCRLFGIQPMVV